MSTGASEPGFAALRKRQAFSRSAHHFATLIYLAMPTTRSYLAPFLIATVVSCSPREHQGPDYDKIFTKDAALVKDSVMATLAASVGGRRVSDTLLARLWPLSEVYTLDVQEALLSDSVPHIVESSLLDIERRGSHNIGYFGPAFGLGGLYLRLEIPDSLLSRLRALHRDTFGTRVYIAFRAASVTRAQARPRLESGEKGASDEAASLSPGQSGYMVEGRLIRWLR